MASKGVLLDTSFIIKLLNAQDPLTGNCESYYRYFLEQGMPIFLSTIAVGEYCVKGKLDELPINQLRILPFNIFHAVRAGELAEIAFRLKREGELNIQERLIIPNDVKLLAQADIEDNITYFISHDKNAAELIRRLNPESHLRFEHID